MSKCLSGSTLIRGLVCMFIACFDHSGILYSIPMEKFILRVYTDGSKATPSHPEFPWA